jgi:pimeloyl-ACP methyl ester carboxylesterase
VFLSYDRNDHVVAEQVRARLMANRVKTWMDRYDIPTGAYWPDEIDVGLSQSTLVLGLLSPDAITSRNVKNEWDWAIHNDKPLILLKIRPCAVPHRYVSINYIDATKQDLDTALDQLMRIPGLRSAPKPVVSPPRTAFVASDGLNIAYHVFGEGDVDLVYVPGSVSHVEHLWKLPAMATFLRGLASFARVIVMDGRGTGMSDRPAQIASLEQRMDDMRAVMDACQSERAVIFGVSEGAPLAILFAATYPARASALVLYGGRVSYVRQPDYPWAKPLESQLSAIEADSQTVTTTWGTRHSAREIVQSMAPSAHGDESLVTWLADLQRLGASPGDEIARRRMNLETDVRHVLSAIHMPTLVLHRTVDLVANIGESRYIADRIPGATFAELPGVDHLIVVGNQESVVAEIERFVQRISG